MAGPNTTITFSAPLTSGDTITLSWTGAGGTVVSALMTAVPLRATSFQFDVGIDSVTQASSYASGIFVDYFSNFNVTYNTGDNFVVVNSKNTNNPISGTSTSSNVTFFPIYSGATSGVTSYSRADIVARSPYFAINTYTGTSDSTLFTIKQYQGDITGFTNARTSYSITKQKMVSTQNNVWINVANLVQEDLEGYISGYTNNNYLTAVNLGNKESKWVYVTKETQYLGAPIQDDNELLFVMDGFLNTNETQQIPNILMTGDKRYLYRDSHERIHFKTDKLTGVSYTTSVNPSATTIIYSGDLSTNQGYVKSIKVDNTGLSDEWVKYKFDYSGQTSQYVTVYFYDECKYDNYDVVFKNKYGALETLSMSKKSSKVLNTTNSSYNRSIVDLEGVIDLNKHVTKQFNVTGNEEWTLNTDFLPEYMNQPIREMMLSEEIWLIDKDSNIVPIVKVDESLNYKTSLNDKMIQYTIRVRLSHETIKYFV